MINYNKQIYPYTDPNAYNKNPQTFLEINKSSFDHNVAYYKNIIGHHNQLGAVIKGNGYGHGLEQMTFLCEQNNLVDWLLMVQLSEAIVLKNVTKPILILGYSDISPEYAVDKNIHFMVDQLEYAQHLNTLGKKHCYQFNIHIKIDTGLSRRGILPQETLDFISQLHKLDYVTITGICSHFIASDTNQTITQQQYTLFNDVITNLHNNNIHIANIHMSNSAALSTIAYESYFNFFRVGMGIYGLGYDKAFLKPIMTWKTHILNIKTIPADTNVGYACTYQTKRPTRVALLPIGYYDGYKFQFSNQTSVIINGHYAPVLGRVAMNMTIVDVTDITANIDDEVIILGPQKNITAHDLALKGNIANPREILVGINPLLNRIITT